MASFSCLTVIICSDLEGFKSYGRENLRAKRRFIFEYVGNICKVGKYTSIVSSCMCSAETFEIKILILIDCLRYECHRKLFELELKVRNFE